MPQSAAFLKRLRRRFHLGEFARHRKARKRRNKESARIRRLIKRPKGRGSFVRERPGDRAALITAFHEMR